MERGICASLVLHPHQLLWYTLASALQNLGGGFARLALSRKLAMLTIGQAN
jgi:hypothetical protein